MKLCLFCLFLSCFFTASTATFAADTNTLPETCRLLPPESGECKALLSIAYYDADRNACDESFYGGCGGVVPFHELADCRAACEKGDTLRLLEFRKESDRPRARLRLSYPRSWGDLPLQARVNDEVADYEVAAEQAGPDYKIVDVVVALDTRPIHKVGVEVTHESQVHQAFVRVHW